jgi:hypothetical protein
MYAFVYNNPIKWLDPYGLNAVTDFPERLKLACLLFKAAKFGESQNEYGAWFYRDGTVDEKKDWWTPEGYGKAVVKKPQRDVEGSFHTHPTFFPDRNGNPDRTKRRPHRPISPEDRDTAKHRWHQGKPMYIISRSGIWSCNKKMMSYKAFRNWCRCHGFWGKNEG